MINPVDTYIVGLLTKVLNRKVKKTSRLFLNGFLLVPGIDYSIEKRNVKFEFYLQKGDIVEIESLEK
jgi:hypothetical protein